MPRVLSLLLLLILGACLAGCGGGGGRAEGGIPSAGPGFGDSGALALSLRWSGQAAKSQALQSSVARVDVALLDPGSGRQPVPITSIPMAEGDGPRTVAIRGIPPGTYTVRADGYDSTGQGVAHGSASGVEIRVGRTTGVSLTMSSGGPISPTVTLTSPQAGQTVTGAVLLTADASDDGGIAQVEFFLDGASVGAVSSPPYQVNWDSSTVTDGSHVVSAAATDTEGLVASDQATVTVSNASLAQPPTVTFTNPLDGAPVTGTVTLQVTATDDVGVAQVEFFLDGNSLGTDTTAPYEQTWDTSTAPNAGKTLLAVATDSDGLTGSDQITVTVANTAAFSIERASVDSAGVQGNNQSQSNPPALDADGSVVLFDSLAANLVAGDTNGKRDSFVRDRATAQTARASVDSAGNEQVANLGSRFHSSLSADGRFAAFSSDSNNLVPGDTNGNFEVFVHDRQAGQTTRASVDSGGNQGDSYSWKPSLSADGRYVCFESNSSNLVPGDTFGTVDIFVHDRQTAQTTRVSVDSAGVPANGACVDPFLSADGRFVTFVSSATNLVPGDTNGVNDVFVHDRQTGQTTRVSVDSAGNQADNIQSMPRLSSDGRFVVFMSLAANLVPGDTNGQQDIFVHDRQTGQTTRVSVDSAGNQGNGACFNSSLSGDGRFVVFDSTSSNLVAGDTNGAEDVFVKDTQTGQVERISLTTASAQANSDSSFPAFSADGRWVVFLSFATNLVAGDTNGQVDVFVARNVMRP